MGKHPDEEHAADLVRKVHDAIHEHTVVDRAAGLMVARYPMTVEQAYAVLREKARETDRDLADVAREILDEGPSP